MPNEVPAVKGIEEVSAEALRSVRGGACSPDEVNDLKRQLKTLEAESKGFVGPNALAEYDRKQKEIDEFGEFGEARGPNPVNSDSQYDRITRDRNKIIVRLANCRADK